MDKACLQKHKARVKSVYICDMENYMVSFRKYRPASFDTVVGQHHITGTLKNAIRTGQLAQAFLFCGPRGVGKTTCARIFAKTINCTQLTTDGEACNNCDSCNSFNKGGSMAIHELDAASNNSVDDIRSLVEQVRYAPQGSKYKIYIIDEVHMLSTAAFNAFLKTLEEPPSYAIFILATTEKHKILPTILSRCQIFDFNRIQIDDIAKQLEKICTQEGIAYEYNALHIIAQKADGALRDALSIMDQVVSFSNGQLSYSAVIDNLNIIDHEYFFRVTEMLLSQELPEVSLLLDEVISKGFDGINFITGLAGHFRNLLMAKDARTLKLLEVSNEIRAQYLEQTQKAPAGFVLSALNYASHCEINYKQSKHPRLLVELSLMKMCFLPNLVHVNAQQEEIKKKTDAQAVTAFKTNAVASVKIQKQENTAETTTEISQVNTSRPNSTGIIKIGKNLAGIKPLKAEMETAAPRPITHELGSMTFSEAWERLLNETKAAKKDYLYALLAEAIPVLNETYEFKIIIHNTPQHQLFESEKQGILEKLRHWTGNFVINFAYDFLKNTSENVKPLTSAEKFGHLAAKNPYLIEFVKLFKLDINY